MFRLHVYLAISSMPALAIALFFGMKGVLVWASVMVVCFAVLYAVEPLWKKKR